MGISAFSKDISGNWTFSIGGDKAEVNISYIDGEIYRLTRKFWDGSDDTSEFRAINEGSDIKLIQNESLDFWILRSNGDLELHDNVGLIPGWKSINATAIKYECKILNLKNTQSIKLDDAGTPHKVNMTEIKVSANFIDKDQFIAATSSLIKKIAVENKSDQVEIWFYPIDNGSQEDHVFYAAYTPDPSKLSFRKHVWESPNVDNKSNAWDDLQPTYTCM